MEENRIKEELGVIKKLELVLAGEVLQCRIYVSMLAKTTWLHLSIEELTKLLTNHKVYNVIELVGWGVVVDTTEHNGYKFINLYKL